eukprot:s4084_g3.t1
MCQLDDIMLLEEFFIRPRLWHIGTIVLLVVAGIYYQSMWIQRELSYDEKSQLLADAAAVVARHNLDNGVFVNWTA